jgi:hypothetical protein
VADNRARLNKRLRASDSDQDDHHRDDRNRRRRLHRDAQLAMIGIAFQRMHVRHLDHRQHRQQGQAQQRCCPESLWLSAAAPAKIWLQSGQKSVSCFKDTQY